MHALYYLIMSESKSEGGTKSSESNNDNDLLDLTFDPSSATAAPSLRQPKLSEAQLLAALELGFSGKYLPSSVTGGKETVPVSSGNSVLDRSNNKIGQASSMINNHSSSNINQNQGSGSQQNQYPLFVDNYSFNLTEEQQQGLLPALRRPDINQLPPGQYFWHSWKRVPLLYNLDIFKLYVCTYLFF